MQAAKDKHTQGTFGRRAKGLLQSPVPCPARSCPALQFFSAAYGPDINPVCHHHYVAGAMFGAAGQWSLQHSSWQPLEWFPHIPVHPWQLERFLDWTTPASASLAALQASKRLQLEKLGDFRAKFAFDVKALAPTSVCFQGMHSWR